MSDVLTRSFLDRSDGSVTFERIQDIEPILDLNKYLQNEPQKWAGTWHHIGIIPNVVLEKWTNEEGVNVLGMSSEEWGQFIKRKLRDPDNKWLRATDRKF